MSGEQVLKSYLKQIHETSSFGDAREESYYHTLESLLKHYAQKSGVVEAHITILPKKTEAGNPDFRVWDGKQHITGYIEAKEPKVGNLDEVENSQQLKRYRYTFPNLVLTNFFQFRLYRNGNLTDIATINKPFSVVPLAKGESDLVTLLTKFFSFSFPKIYDAETLALELAKRTRFLRDEVIKQRLIEEEGTAKSFQSGFYEAFRQFLIGGLTKEELDI